MEDLYLSDVLAQPKAVKSTIETYSRELRHLIDEVAAPTQHAGGIIHFTGMGASLFVCKAAKTLTDRFGIRSTAEDTSYLVDYGLRTLGRDDILVIVSQSGESIEAKRLIAGIKGRVRTILVTNCEDSAVAKVADIVIPTRTSDDYSVAIKTYTVSMAVVFLLIHEIADQPPHEATSLLRKTATYMEEAVMKSLEAAEGLARFFKLSSYIQLLGRGPSIASALEGALLFKEGAKVPSEGMSGGQFRHGSIEVVDSGTHCILFAPKGATQSLNARLVAELKHYGARLLVISGPKMFQPDGTQVVFEVEAPDEYVAPLVEIIPVQLLVHRLAYLRGILPGSFRNTSPVITSE